MTNAMAAFGIAAGGTSLICYLLMTRKPKRRALGGSSRDSSGLDGSRAGGDGWSLVG